MNLIYLSLICLLLTFDELGEAKDNSLGSVSKPCPLKAKQGEKPLSFKPGDFGWNNVGD